MCALDRRMVAELTRWVARTLGNLARWVDRGPARYQALGHAFVLIEATNQWTGAACEALGATRVHFAPFRAHRTVRRSAEPLADIVTSPDGFLSGKDSGSMLYVIRTV
jgi:hypothetical protein